MTKERAWQTKEGALKALKKLAGSAKAAVQAALPDIVPVGSECLVDAREQVWQAVDGTAGTDREMECTAKHIVARVSLSASHVTLGIFHAGVKWATTALLITAPLH